MWTDMGWSVKQWLELRLLGAATMPKGVALVIALVLLTPAQVEAAVRQTETGRAGTISNEVLLSSGTCKTFSNGEAYRLCISGKKGSITRLSDSGQINFALDNCRPNSNSYIASYTEKNGGIDMATYRSAIWDYCNKGWRW
jgi:hypothetical protein